MNKYFKIFFIAFILMISFEITILPDEDIKFKKLHYNVDVVGKSLNFRVYYKGEMVKNLKKQDFKLFVSGKEIRIESFDEKRKKINIKSDEHADNRRLFVLIFNISDHRLNMKDNILYFFDKILKKGDRLIFISNRFFLNDRIVFDVAKEKEKIIKLLELEKSKIRIEKMRLRAYLSRVLEETFEYLNDEEGILLGRRHFVTTYMRYLREFKYNYLNLDTSQYINLTQYLANLKMDKWVLCFYQIGGFYRPDRNIDLIVHKDPLYSSLLEQLDVVNKLPENDLSKYFVKSGATLYTIFMKNSGFPSITYNTGKFIIQPDVSDPSSLFDGGEIYNISLNYKKIASNSENYFSLASKMSGGKVFSSRKTEKFFKTITSREDIMYSISFSTLKKDRVIKLVPNNKKYKVLYDNQKKSTFMKDQVKKINIIDIPQVNINEITFKKGILFLSIINYKMIKTLKKLEGSIELKLKVLNSRKTVLNKKKSFKTFLANTDLKIKLPKLKKGKYSVIVEVKDLNTERNDIVVYDFVK